MTIGTATQVVSWNDQKNNFLNLRGLQKFFQDLIWQRGKLGESDARREIEKNTGMSTYPIEILRANLDRFCDNRPGPEEQLIAAESAWLAIPPWRRPRNFSTALIGIDLIWTDRVIGYIPQPLIPCPACHDHPIGRCLVCSASNEDPVRWPMMPRKERLKILAGPPLRKQVAETKTRLERRTAVRRMPT